MKANSISAKFIKKRIVTVFKGVLRFGAANLGDGVTFAVGELIDLAKPEQNHIWKFTVLDFR